MMMMIIIIIIIIMKLFKFINNFLKLYKFILLTSFELFIKLIYKFI